MITSEQAAVAKGLLQRGDKQHDIAAFFGVNGGRIAEIATGAKFKSVVPVAKRDLPTPAMVASGFAIYFSRQALIRAKLGIEQAMVYLDDCEARRDADAPVRQKPGAGR